MIRYCVHGLAMFISFVFGAMFVESVLNHLYQNIRIVAALFPGAAIFAGFMGFLVTRELRSRSAPFVFVAPLILFLASWYGLATDWNASWSHESRLEYVLDNLIGPNCASSECLYTIGTMIVLPAALYSLGAFAAMRRVARATSQTPP